MKLKELLSLYKNKFYFSLCINEEIKYISIDETSNIDNDLLNTEIDYIEQYPKGDIIYLKY